MSFKRILKNYLSRVFDLSTVNKHLYANERNINELKILTAKNLIHKLEERGPLRNIKDSEFQVFSQFGDDGIIQYLIMYSDLTVDFQYFIEFGVQDYRESNTRFLLLNNNWKGLIIDANKEYMAKVKNEELYWRHELISVCEFITKDNINNILIDNGFSGQQGLLSIDIDGNDYWVWKEITSVNPVIIVVEYNSLFGYERAVTVPYKEDFLRSTAHFSNQYWGCSIKALDNLAKEKGYLLVGSNSAGNNAFFVREDMIGKIKAVPVEEAYVISKYRDSRDHSGNLNFLSREERLDLIKDLDLYDVELNKQIKVSDIII